MLSTEREIAWVAVRALRQLQRPSMDLSPADRDLVREALAALLPLVEQQPGESAGVSVLGGKVFANILHDTSAPTRAGLLQRWFDLEAPMLVCLDFARLALFTRQRGESTAHLREVWAYVRRLASLVADAPAEFADAPSSEIVDA